MLGVPKLSTPRAFRAIRLNDDGSFDNTFGVGGQGEIPSPSQVRISDMVIQPDNKIVIGGYDIFDGDWNFMVTRFLANGMPDTSFGTQGRVVTDFSRTGVSNPQDFLQTIALQSDGKLLVGGHSNTESGSSGNYVHALARYDVSGSLDPNFGDAGQSVFQLDTSQFALEQITDIHVLPDGKFLATSGARSETVLMKFLPDGSFDNSFGTGGRVIAPSNAPWENPNALLLDNQGRMLLGNSDSFSVTRLLPDGTVDNSFGINGTFDIDVGQTFRTNVTSLDWAADGELLIGGYSVVTANVDSDWHVAKVLVGTPPPTQTINLVPTFDVKSILGPPTSITDGEDTLTVGLGFNAENPEERPIMEFSLGDIPDGSTITGATLTLDPVFSSGSPRVEILAYPGDGLASLSDLNATGQVVATTGPVDALMTTIEAELSPAYIQGLLESSSHLGLRLRSLDLPLYVGFDSTESGFGSPPLLSLTYTIPGGPSDFNKDGVVDRQDLLKWEASYGSNADADANGDGRSDGLDFFAWQTSAYGQASQLQAVQTVPEPTTATLCSLTLIVWNCRRRAGVRIALRTPPPADHNI